MGCTPAGKFQGCLVISVPLGAMEWDQFLAVKEDAEGLEDEVTSLRRLLQLPCFAFSETQQGRRWATMR
jgi:hypothetical protein